MFDNVLSFLFVVLDDEAKLLNVESDGGIKLFDMTSDDGAKLLDVSFVPCTNTVSTSCFSRSSTEAKGFIGAYNL